MRTFQRLLGAGGLFVFALTAFGSLDASGGGRADSAPWEFTHCEARSKKFSFNERLISSNEDLRQLDKALGSAYRAKEAFLDSAQIEALHRDHFEWQITTCRDVTGRHASAEIVRKCLVEAMRLRRTFVTALPVDRADVPYRLSTFERLLLSHYAGNAPGILNTMISAPDDATRAGVRRVFAAIMPGEASQSAPAMAPHTVSDFIENAFGDGAEVEAGRYFVDYGAKIHDGSQQGMFVVDLSTGDVTMASISAQTPAQLYIWELACTPEALREFSRIRFRRAAHRSAEQFALPGQPTEPVREHIHTKSCS
jgi:hypothetical protein